MLRIFSILFFIVLLESSCSHNNLLTYKHRKYYREKSIITSDSTLKLLQSVSYNVPNIIDEEFSYDLTLQFIDTTAAIEKGILNLSTDTTIVKSNYSVFSAWDWDDYGNKVEGTIEIITWDKNSITLKENIQTFGVRRKEIKKYKGTRIFYRKEGW
jgi:hypothetical protein